jgi:hypothetical protein
MKYPSYLRECEIKQTISFFKTIRKKDGIEAADLFKRISLTAAYGELYLGKISYSSFLDEVSRFIKYSYNNFIEFWNLKHEATLSKTYRVYNTNEKIIVNGTMTELETEIITQLRNRLNNINPRRKDDYYQILINYDTDGNQ